MSRASLVQLRYMTLILLIDSRSVIYSKRILLLINPHSDDPLFVENLRDTKYNLVMLRRKLVLNFYKVIIKSKVYSHWIRHLRQCVLKMTSKKTTAWIYKRFCNMLCKNNNITLNFPKKSENVMLLNVTVRNFS